MESHLFHPFLEMGSDLNFYRAIGKEMTPAVISMLPQKIVLEPKFRFAQFSHALVAFPLVNPMA
jgi:hypothetical protein